VLSTYNRTYDRDEFAKRYAIFSQNIELIRKHNSEGHTFTLGINEFADQTFEEFKVQHYGTKKHQSPYLRSKNVEVLPTDSLPSTVDWSSKGAVTPIKNQGQCGSCWAFSTTGSVEGLNAIKTGNLQSFSEQELVDCGGRYGNQGCNGGLMDSGFEFVVQNGLCLESEYPYSGRNGNCKKSSCSSSVKISGYRDVPRGNSQALQAAVAQQPVSVAIEADRPVFQFYNGGVITSQACGQQLDHGVLVVGYGDSNGTPYWKVKNSWGASWGMQGYVLIERNAGGVGICGITSQPSYPTL